MGSDDPLDKETSVSAELKENGVTAKSNSRAINAFDRLVGNIADWANVRIEGDTTIRRATTEAKKTLIEAATAAGVARLKTDPQFAERALDNHFDKIFQRQANRDAVAEEAIEQLRIDPPTEEQSNSGPDTINPATMERIEHYAEFASSEELRQRWGRVLASEVRQPGTFSQKVLRVIDELDGDTAARFEQFCQHRIGPIVPKALSGELDHSVMTDFVVSGLLVEPGLGKIWKGTRADRSSDDRQVIWRLNGPYAMAIEHPCTAKTDKILSDQYDTTCLHVNILTDAGTAIATILPDLQDQATQRLYAVVAMEISPKPVRRLIAWGDQYRLVDEVRLS